MGSPRQVTVEAQVVAFWSSHATSAFALGLMVGQVSSSNAGDFVLDVVPLPSESESGDALTGLGDVSVEWLQAVAQQVDRLLPGGITVLGLYVVSTSDAFARVVPYLRAAAEAVALSSSAPAIDTVHYVSIVSPEGTFELQSYDDVTDVNKTQTASAVPKAATAEIKFKQYRTLVEINEAIVFATEATKAATASTEVADTRLDEFEHQLQSLVRRVDEAVAVPKATDDTHVQHVHLLARPPTPSRPSVEEPLGGIQGTISCIAFVSESEPKAADVAARYLKRDFSKSLRVRLSLARERWTDDSRDKPTTAAVFQSGGVIGFPQRGLVPWRAVGASSPHFDATVYVFPDEDAEQVVQDALEVLGEDRLTGGESHWAALETTRGRSSGVTDPKRSELGHFQPTSYVLLSLVIVLAVAFVVPYSSVLYR
ncbi:unnamed protein product [Hyaloperonospora brassicae]|uniref:JAB1/MPN/MOV34 metalloenzyme domain-containing protein n=1 Tax=Hyaloperonospora brassicae TaxID=162125 RepID=A0AAV0UT39_HYABA|nr:unnamed protein product [Hyaloperonospora brassicae]